MFLILLMAWLVAAGPLLALTVFSVEVLTGLRLPSRVPLPDRAGQGDVAVLIPAHNEASGIVATIEGLRAIAPERCRILVVADNCQDNTAALARSAGAEVVERDNLEERGKGYALSFGRSVLAANPPATVVVVDADAALAPGSIEHLCRVTDTGYPAQALNLLTPDLAAPALVQISNFAFLVKNLVRGRALGRIGCCTLLTGSGMAFPWALFATAPLASGDITEDLALGIAMTRANTGARLVEQAAVRSGAASVEASVGQRRRWEHGFLASATRHALPLLLEGLSRGSRSSIAFALHLMVPPLALLLFASLGALLLLLVVGALSGLWAPAIALGIMVAVALGLTAIAWLAYGRGTLAFGALLQAPLYVFWKLPLYARFLVNRETSWQRTKREGDD